MADPNRFPVTSTFAGLRLAQASVAWDVSRIPLAAHIRLASNTVNSKEGRCHNWDIHKTDVNLDMN